MRLDHSEICSLTSFKIVWGHYVIAPSELDLFKYDFSICFINIYIQGM